MTDTIFNRLLNKINLKEDRHLFENATQGSFLEYMGFLVTYSDEWLSARFMVSGDNKENIFILEFVDIVHADLNHNHLTVEQLKELELTLIKLIKEL